MDNFRDVVKDKNNKLTKNINDMLSENKDIEILTTYRNGEPIIEFKKDPNSVLLRGKYEILGAYNPDLKIYEWSYNFRYKLKTLTDKAMKIKKYKKTLLDVLGSNKYGDNDYIERIIYYISNPIVVIEEKTNLADIMNISIYITECIGILALYGDKTNLILHIITDILTET